MQKTAFEVRISDWSSDVCSSYLTVGTRVKASYSDANFEVDDAPVDGQNRSGRLSLERTSFFGNADVLSLNAGISRTVSNADFTAADITFISTRITDRKSVVSGRSVSVRVDLGGCRIIKKKDK